MQLSNTPSKLVRPFADAGGRSTIPVASQIGVTAGAASLTDGFPPLTRTPVAAGGVPPSGLDMNGILYEMSAAIRWANAGGGYAFDGAFAADTNVGGYPKGARVMRSDGQGYWFNTAEGNTTDPESPGSAAAGWVPDFQPGAAVVSMASASVTLTPEQYGKPLIIITGTLTANLNLVFPAIVGQWAVINETTGGYTVTAKTATGAGAVVGGVSHIIGDGGGILIVSPDFVRLIPNIAALRNTPPTIGVCLQTRGYFSENDGGQGRYVAKTGGSTGAYVDDGGATIVPNGGDGSSAWLLSTAAPVSVKQFGARGGAADDSLPIRRAFEYIKQGGGTLDFPRDDYAFYLDISGSNPPITFRGNGSSFYPVSVVQTNSSVIYANNSTGLGQAEGTNSTFCDINFSGRMRSSVDPNYGDIDTPVHFRSAWAKFYTCQFSYGKVAGLYSLFGQYNQFYECNFGGNVYSPATAGCWLDSNSVAEAANENSFFRCTFNTNAVGLKILGGLANRAYGCQFQNNSQSGALLDQDSAGFGGNQSLFSGCYFEANTTDVTIGAAEHATFEATTFLPGKVSTTHCYGLRFIANTFYGSPSFTFAHPSGATDTAALTWVGNNATPTPPQVAGLLHAGATYLDIRDAETGSQYASSFIGLAGSVSTAVANNVVLQNWSGVANAVPKGTVTPAFKLRQSAFANPSARVAVFTAALYLWDDGPASTQFGYSGHVQRYSVLISNTNTGAPQVNIVAESAGQDVGINTSVQAPGPVTLTATVSGDTITFNVAWAGTGSAAGAMAQQAVGYSLQGAGTNQFTLITV